MRIYRISSSENIEVNGVQKPTDNMSKRAAWQLSEDGVVVSGGDEKRRAAVVARNGDGNSDGNSHALTRLGDLVMCLIMSFLPEFTGAPLTSMLTRIAVRSVCKTWRARRYDRWVHPWSAYMLALRAGDEVYANRLWTMRREWLGACSLDMLALATYGNVMQHVDRLFAQLQLHAGTRSTIVAALHGAALGGRVGMLQYVIDTYGGGPTLSRDLLFSGSLVTSSLKDPWSVAVIYGHVDMVQFLLIKLEECANGDPYYIAEHTDRAIVLAAVWGQSDVVALLWPRRFANDDDRLLFRLYVHYNFTTDNLYRYVELFLKVLLPLSTIAQRQKFLKYLAAGACREPAYAHGMLLILPSVTDHKVRSAALQQMLITNSLSCGQRQPLIGAYAQVVDTLKEYAFDNMRAAKIFFECAIAQNRFDLVRYMLRHDQSTKLLQQCGVGSLHTACRLGHLDVVNALLDDPRIDPTASNNLAMRSAQRHKHEKVEMAIRCTEVARSLVGSLVTQ